jgi:hypothetical protein
MVDMSYPYMPIDVEGLSRRALRGYGPEDPEPLPPREGFLTRLLRRQPTARPRWTPVEPASSRSRASARNVPSSVR